MITNKDVRVENGNIVINGDKFPLDGQSPETIMEIVEDNSDTTPTENSDAPVTSGGVKTYVDNAVSQIYDESLNNLRVSISSNTSKNFTVSSGFRGVILFASTGASYCGEVALACSGGGVVIPTKIGGAAGITLASTENNTLTVTTATDGTMACFIFFTGTVTEAN